MNGEVFPLLSERARLLAEFDLLRKKLARKRHARRHVERKRAISARLAVISAEIKRANSEKT